jgi:hypothetical protein
VELARELKFVAVRVLDASAGETVAIRNRDTDGMFFLCWIV